MYKVWAKEKNCESEQCFTFFHTFCLSCRYKTSEWASLHALFTSYTTTQVTDEENWGRNHRLHNVNEYFCLFLCLLFGDEFYTTVKFGVPGVPVAIRKFSRWWIITNHYTNFLFLSQIFACWPITTPFDCLVFPNTRIIFPQMSLWNVLDTTGKVQKGHIPEHHYYNMIHISAVEVVSNELLRQF